MAAGMQEGKRAAHARHQRPPRAMALGIAKHVWSIGELLDAALAVASGPDRDGAK